MVMVVVVSVNVSFVREGEFFFFFRWMKWLLFLESGKEKRMVENSWFLV